MKYLYFLLVGAILTIGAPSVASACAMGYGTQHNYDHDGTPNCASCTCAHNKDVVPGEEAALQHGDDGHVHEKRGIADRLLRENGDLLAKCTTYKVICGRICTPRRVKNGGVWITIQDCRPKYCDHTTCR